METSPETNSGGKLEKLSVQEIENWNMAPSHRRERLLSSPPLSTKRVEETKLGLFVHQLSTLNLTLELATDFEIRPHSSVEKQLGCKLVTALKAPPIPFLISNSRAYAFGFPGANYTSTHSLVDSIACNARKENGSSFFAGRARELIRLIPRATPGNWGESWKMQFALFRERDRNVSRNWINKHQKFCWWNL